ncbi:MAG: hypothetical protein KDD58_10780 [Bdellovibrionales bacterium]|nr:hypothetical protein [Bdellovibrionales bacterium]
MSKYLFLLASIMLSSSLLAAELCLQGTISGQKDLATPWPLQVHGERHTQIQRTISIHKRNAKYCIERFGDLPEAVQFFVSANGSIDVDESTVKSEAAECIAEILRNVSVGNYSCDMSIPYKWNGKFPLLNAERIEF